MTPPEAPRLFPGGCERTGTAGSAASACAARPGHDPDPRRQPRDFLRALYDAAVQRRAAGAQHRRVPAATAAKGRTVVLGAGKAGGAMARRSKRCGRPMRRCRGLVVTRYDHVPPACRATAAAASRWSRPRTRCPTRPAARPPQRILELAQGLTADDLVLCLISRRRLGAADAAGRGPDAATTSSASTARCCDSGAAIGEMNCVRKHLSAHQGRAAGRAPARRRGWSRC